MHTGLFPEQAAHWTWMTDRLGPAPGGEFLNLFAYTGGASIALAGGGARVTHVDASRPSIGWARRNAALNGATTIRWIEDDARAFVARARRRGKRFDGLLLDPPMFGRSPGGVWRLERDLEPLLDAAIALLAADARFVLLNVYGSDASDPRLHDLIATRLRVARHPLAGGRIDSGSLDLHTADGRPLSTGAYARVGIGTL
jgi:23S rRNA (cytosine1962-C5)-methyltransferase